jgi:ATP adenylyltransferase
MPLDHLWATWRSGYVRSISGGDAVASGSGAGDAGTPGVPDPATLGGRSLFEAILQSGAPDEETLIVHRGRHCFVLLNRFPYTSGHLMVLPNRAVADIEALSDAEHDELWALVRDAVVALKASLRCHGINVGVNLGAVAGGSQADHLHVHCVPRWQGDTNFMGAVAETRVLPVGLPEAWTAVRDAWPAPPAD